MDTTQTCPQGHTWEAGPASCPVCGAAPADSANAETLAPDNGQSAGADAAAPTQPATSPPSALQVSVAGYEILEVLGRGGMGVVYKARQTRLKRLVALKMILAGAHADAADVARFRREAEAIAQLQHANIVQIYEVGEQEGLPFISLELLAGGSLAGRLNGTPWPASAAAELVATLAGAMQAAHESGVVHRDLKPGNVLFTRDDVPKITDFGLAKRFDDAAAASTDPRTRSGAIVGTPSYMAPEQAGGGADGIGPPADVYALGTILYELLTGRPPFRAATALDTVLQVLNDEPVAPRRLLPKLPRDLETICLRCLQKAPARRYASAAALADDLRRFLDGLPITARPVGLWERGIKWARRRPAVAGLLAALVVVLIAAFTGMATLWLRAEDQRAAAEQARADAENSASLARKNEQEAHAQEQRAATSYRLARTALEKTLKLGQDPRFQKGELEDVRRQLHEAAASFYEKFAQLQSDDPSFRQERADALFALGEASAALGSKEEGLTAYGHALDLYEQLGRDQPTSSLLRKDQAMCLNNMAILHGELGRADQAEKLFLQAQPLWQRLMEDDPDEPYYKDRFANTLHNLSQIYRHTSRPREAEESLLKAIALREELVKARPNDESCQIELNSSRFVLGVLYCTTRRPDKAERTLLQARDSFKELVQKNPQEEDRVASLAKVYNSLGVLYADTDRQQEAEKALREAVALKEKLAHEHPAVSHYQEDLANSYNSLGLVCFETRRFAEAATLWEKSLAIMEKLLERNPNDVHLLVGLGGSSCNFGLNLMGQNKTADALPWFDKARDRLRAVLKHQPRETVAREFLLKTYAGRGRALLALHREADALTNWDEALAIAGADQRDAFRLMHAMTLARMGKYADAAPEADDLARQKQLPGPVLYDLACVHALCARDKTQTEHHAAQALALLRRAQAAGFFVARPNRENFQKDEDFDALRQRSDFETLAKSLAP
jgi:tetratricopeptide (TPR) repeat protein/tRNA A-37 threonylcarbamoyl transferase component Bud32